MKHRNIKKEDLPQAVKAVNETITLGEFRQFAAEHPEMDWPSIGYSDRGGFESCLPGCNFFITADGYGWITFQSDCKPWGKEFINFKHEKITKSFGIKRKKIPEWLKELEEYSSDLQIFMARRMDFSPFGNHMIIPIYDVGPQVWVNGKEEYSYDEDTFSIYGVT